MLRLWPDPARLADEYWRIHDILVDQLCLDMNLRERFHVNVNYRHNSITVRHRELEALFTHWLYPMIGRGEYQVPIFVTWGPNENGRRPILIEWLGNTLLIDEFRQQVNRPRRLSLRLSTRRGLFPNTLGGTGHNPWEIDPSMEPDRREHELKSSRFGDDFLGLEKCFSCR